MSRNLIVIAHPGDEILGCYSVLKDLSRECDVLLATAAGAPGIDRLRRASKALLFRALDCLDDDLSGTVYESVYVPSRGDGDEYRREVSALYRSVATHFYHIDSTPTRPALVHTTVGMKVGSFTTLYPEINGRLGRNGIWDADVFELSDHERSRVVLFRNGWKAVVPEQYGERVQKVLPEVLGAHEPDPQPEEVFDALVGLCPSGSVVLTTKDRQWSTT